MSMHPLYIAFTAFDVTAVVTTLGALACWLGVVPVSAPDTPHTVRRVLTLGVVLLTLSCMGILVSRTLEMDGGAWAQLPSALPLVLRVTHYGHIWLWRLPALALLWWGWWWTWRHPQHRAAVWLMALAAAGIALTRSETGHPADNGDFTLAVWIDWLHLVAGSVWIGGLFGMSLAVFPSLHRAGDAARVHAAEIFQRLSTLAGYALAVIVLSGGFIAWRELGGWSALWNSAYGHVLAVKVLLVAIMIGLGAHNRYRKLPRLLHSAGKPVPRPVLLGWLATVRDAARRGPSANGPVVRSCARAVDAESLLGVGVLLAASILLHGMPPADMPRTAVAGMSAMPGMSTPAGPVPALGPHRWLNWREAQAYLERSAHAGRMDRAGHVHFRGSAVTLDLVAVAPHAPDMSFELAGRVDPTLVVPAGAHITLRLLNMDYGPGMDHGVIVTPVGPPYPALGVERLAHLAVLAPIPARRAAALPRARYAEAGVRFTAPAAPGTYYYACQWPGHAEGDHMYGRLEVVGAGR